MSGLRSGLATALLGFALAGALGSALFSEASALSVVFVAFAVVGWLVARKDPDNAVGWLLLGFGAIGGVNGAMWTWAAAARAWDLPGSAVAVWSQSWLWAPMLGVSFGPLLVLFPDGRVPSRRWRFVLWASAVFVVLAGVGNALYPLPMEDGRVNPYAVESAAGLLRLAQNLGGVALMVSLLGGVAALAVRYRRADGVQRQQMKWFLAAAALLPVATVIGEAGNQALQDIAIPVGLALLAVATGIAILRHGLYDIDRIISRTVAWALLTVIVGGIYSVGVTVLTSMTATAAVDSPLATAAATLAAAAAFGPARRRIQTVVDRRFNRARYDARRTVDGYRLRLRDELDMDSISEGLQTAVASTLQPRATTLWLRTPEVRA